LDGRGWLGMSHLRKGSAKHGSTVFDIEEECGKFSFRGGRKKDLHDADERVSGTTVGRWLGVGTWCFCGIFG